MNKKIKMYLSSLLVVGILLGSSLSFAKPINVYYDNKKMDLPVNPIIMNGRVLVPMRATFDLLHFDLEWNNTDRTVTAYRDSLEVKLTIDSKYATVSSWDWDLEDDVTTIKELDAPATIVDGHTLVPIRFVSECLGKLVLWDNNTRSVFIEGYPFEFED